MSRRDIYYGTSQPWSGELKYIRDFFDAVDEGKVPGYRNYVWGATYFEIYTTDRDIMSKLPIPEKMKMLNGGDVKVKVFLVEGKERQDSALIS